jgi:hypothetical protein
MNTEFDRWLASRPESVQRLAAKFPIGTRVILDNQVHWLLGYTEDDKLIISPVDPNEDYDRSKRVRTYICASHLERT